MQDEQKVYWSCHEILHKKNRMMMMSYLILFWLSIYSWYRSFMRASSNFQDAFNRAKLKSNRLASHRFNRDKELVDFSNDQHHILFFVSASLSWFSSIFDRSHSNRSIASQLHEFKLTSLISSNTEFDEVTMSEVLFLSRDLDRWLMSWKSEKKRCRARDQNNESDVIDSENFKVTFNDSSDEIEEGSKMFELSVMIVYFRRE